MEGKEQPFYRKENGENLTDLHVIQSSKNEQNRDIIDNARLGSYDKFGNYILLPEILSELLHMPKIVIGTTNLRGKKIYELRGYIPIFGYMFFKIYRDEKEATLLLVETVTREFGGYTEIYEEKLGSILVSKSSAPESLIFKAFGVVSGDDVQSLFMSPYEVENILLRKVYMVLLSKELGKVLKFDEKRAFGDMIDVLKNSGEYGKRVIGEFTHRIKDRPEIFDIRDRAKYDKAVNEVLLSSLDIVTTKKDREDSKIHDFYVTVLNARNTNIKEYIKKSSEKVDEKYIKDFVSKVTQDFSRKIADKTKIKGIEEQEEYVVNFYDKFSQGKNLSNKDLPENLVLKVKKLGESDLKLWGDRELKPRIQEIKSEKKLKAEPEAKIRGKDLKTKEEKIRGILEKKKKAEGSFSYDFGGKPKVSTKKTKENLEGMTTKKPKPKKEVSKLGKKSLNSKDTSDKLRSHKEDSKGISKE